MQIRIRESSAVMFWNEFRTLLLEQNPLELITVAPQTEEWLDAHGADIVFEGPQATGGTVYQYSQRQGVEQIDGKWYTKYVLGPIFMDTPATNDLPAKTAVEYEAEYKAIKDVEQAQSIRQQRNEILSKTDWRFRSDMNPSQDWVNYCQALRDVPTQSGFPWEINWPTEP
jgi:hypothetical protein